MTLTAARVSLRPNLHSLCLLGLLGAMLFVGGVQDNSAAYLLAFLTAMLALLSALRARENLRGLQLAASALGGRAAQLHLRASTQSGAHGIELCNPRDPTAGWIFLDHIEAATQQSLPWGTLGAGRHLLIRSHYPLGLFTAQCHLRLPIEATQLPPAAGGLALPEPEGNEQQEEQGRHGASSQSNSGDDFAGLRPWQSGESPRRIFWRAHARGRPLLVKQWQQPSSPLVVLHWNHLPGSAQQRVAQLLQWIGQLRQRQWRWRLELPDQTLGPDEGAHFEGQCRLAMGRLLEQSNGTEDKPQRRQILPTGHEYQSRLPRGPLALLCGVLLACGLLLQEILPLATTALFALCCCWRLLGPQPTPPTSLRRRLVHWPSLLTLIVGAGVLQWSTGKLLSLESGIAILMVLLGSKLLESRSAHDFQVLAMVGWFLCLCGLLSNQTLTRSLCILSFFTLIAACMNRFRRHAPGAWQPLRTTAILIAQAMVLAGLVYFAFPRGSLAFLSRMGVERRTISGINEELKPGSISELVQSHEVAFRSEFPTLDEPPPAESRYWRCVVLWHCEDGLSWQRRPPTLTSAAQSEVRRPPQASSTVTQTIQLLPTGQGWLPSMDRPLAGQINQRPLPLSPDDCLRAMGPVETVFNYQTTSLTSQRFSAISAEERLAALQLPPQISAQTRQLAASWRRDQEPPQQWISRAIAHLQSKGFTYSLDPGLYDSKRALDEFLFERRKGFCEHYAASFATLMRATGIPARVVIGYMGGEWSQRGGYMIVRQSDAHSWVEVWLAEVGWVRVDPTIALVPGRMTQDLQSLLAQSDDAWLNLGDRLWQQHFQQARLWWDQLEYNWYSRVISFDEEAQYGWLRSLGLERWQGWGALALAAALVTALLLPLLWLWRRPAIATDPLAAAWLNFCDRLASQGLPPRGISEAAGSYARRLAQISDQPSMRALCAVIEEYSALRYGHAGSPLLRRAWMAKVRRWPKSLPHA